MEQGSREGWNLYNNLIHWIIDYIIDFKNAFGDLYSLIEPVPITDTWYVLFTERN